MRGRVGLFGPLMALGLLAMWPAELMAIGSDAANLVVSAYFEIYFDADTLRFGCF